MEEGLLDRIKKVSAFYEREAAAFDEPHKCRHLGPEECKAIALLFREAEQEIARHGEV